MLVCTKTCVGTIRKLVKKLSGWQSCRRGLVLLVVRHLMRLPILTKVCSQPWRSINQQSKTSAKMIVKPLKVLLSLALLKRSSCKKFRKWALMRTRLKKYMTQLLKPLRLTMQGVLPLQLRGVNLSQLHRAIFKQQCLGKVELLIPLRRK